MVKESKEKLNIILKVSSSVLGEQVFQMNKRSNNHIYRYIVVKACRELTLATSIEIASALGYANHTSVLHALKKFDDWCNDIYDPDSAHYKKLYNEIIVKASKQIRDIEDNDYAEQADYELMLAKKDKMIKDYEKVLQETTFRDHIRRLKVQMNKLEGRIQDLEKENILSLAQ